MGSSALRAFTSKSTALCVILCFPRLRLSPEAYHSRLVAVPLSVFGHLPTVRGWKQSRVFPLHSLKL